MSGARERGPCCDGWAAQAGGDNGRAARQAAQQAAGGSGQVRCRTAQAVASTAGSRQPRLAVLPSRAHSPSLSTAAPHRYAGHHLVRTGTHMPGWLAGKGGPLLRLPPLLLLLPLLPGWFVAPAKREQPAAAPACRHCLAASVQVKSLQERGWHAATVALTDVRDCRQRCCPLSPMPKHCVEPRRPALPPPRSCRSVVGMP